MKKTLFQNGFAMFGLVMVVATITLVGFVAFKFLDAQDNTRVANETTTQQTSTEDTSNQVATVETVEDVEAVTEELDTLDTEIEELDAELNEEFAF